MGLLTLAWRRRQRLALVGFLLMAAALMTYYTRPADKLDIDYGHLDVLFSGDHVSYNNMIQFQLADELLSEAEKEALRAVISPNIDTEPSRENSTLHLVPSNETDSGRNNITVRLDLRDSRGRLVRYSGHQVRMWITSVPPDEKSAVLSVTDLSNGSYVSSFPALWPGKTVVHAAMIFSRDVHYVMTKTIANLKNPQPLVGGFVRGDCKQATLCGPFPVIPGYPASCNHTSLNSGLGWYCGKPTEECLSCDDLKVARRFKLRGFPRPYLPEVDRTFYKWYNVSMKARSWIFEMNHTLTVLSDARPPPEPRVPCSAMKPRDTWNIQSPLGYLEKETWHSLACALPPWDMGSLTECFRGATFWFVGDSNARMMFQDVCELIDGYVDPKVIKGHIPLFCENIRKDLDLNVAWYPHEYPFQGGNGVWYDLSVKKSPRYYMNQIPAAGKYYVLVHLLAHFINYPTAVYAEHVRDVARGARDLCRRNPSAKIVIRGPSCWVNEVKGDYLTTFSREVLRREFRELRDCVIYLDSFDITLSAGGCNHVHPPIYATKQVTRSFLGHVCYGTRKRRVTRFNNRSLKPSTRGFQQ